MCVHQSVPQQEYEYRNDEQSEDDYQVCVYQSGEDGRVCGAQSEGVIQESVPLNDDNYRLHVHTHQNQVATQIQSEGS